MLNFTDRQARAIKTRGNVLVSAAAGSGKTRVLTERICQILTSEEVDISEILVLTFTEAAAAEMKSRIYNRLYNESIENQSQELGIISESVVKADISTIHSFCNKLIRENYFALGLSPSFTIGADVEAKKLLGKCLSDILEQKLNDKDADVLYLYQQFGKRTGEALKEMVLKIYYELKVLPEPQKYREEILAQYDSSEYREKIKEILREDIGKKLEASLETLQDLIKLSLKCDFEKTAVLLDIYIEETKNHIQTFNDKPYEQYARLPYMKNQFRIDKMDEDIKKVFVEAKNFARDMVKSTKEVSHLVSFEENFKTEKDIVKKDVTILFDLVFELIELFQDKKAHANFLDFSDLEHFAYKVLKQGASGINYKYIFIDEYQDTNPIQDAIIAKVSGGKNQFMVGDVKQSIYGFRHAEPQIFLEKQEEYDEFFESKVNHDDELIRMNENFRSSKGVVDAINKIMSNVLTKDFGGIDYKSEESLKHRSILKGGNVSLLVVDTNENFYECEEDAKNLTSKEAEANIVASQIKQILGQTIYSREHESEKQIDYSDIVVLLRELKNTGLAYKKVFESLGIPVECDIEAAKEIAEIKVFINLLKIANNPIDDIALLSVMKFEHFGFTSNDFVKIKAGNTKISFYQSLNLYISENDDKLKEKLVGFLETLEDIRTKAKILPKKELLDYCIKLACFEEILAVSQNSKLEMLKAYAAELNSQTPKTAGLARMVEFIIELENSGQKLKVKSSQKSSNAVKIMTIHKSKGLEFPVVFLGGLDKGLILANRSNMNIDRNLGVGLKLIDPQASFIKDGIIFTAINKSKHYEEITESIRLLYVAMTRAENMLYMVGAKNALNSAIPKWLFSKAKRMSFSKSFLDFIAPCLINKKGFFDGFEISRFMPPNLNEYEDIPFLIKPKISLKSSDEDFRAIKFEQFNNINQNQVEIGYEYTYNDTLNTPSKKSVSSLNKKDESESAWNFDEKILKRNLVQNDKLSGAAIGTAHHVFMQHVDYNKYSKQDIVSQAKQFVEKNIITYQELQCLNTDFLYKILNSNIFDRIRKSKRVHRELNFTYKVDSAEIGKKKGETVLIQGTVDCLFLEDGEYVIIDYKTDRKVTREKIEKYTKQVDYYDRAVRKITDKNVKARYLYFIYDDLYSV